MRSWNKLGISFFFPWKNTSMFSSFTDHNLVCFKNSTTIVEYYIRLADLHLFTLEFLDPIATHGHSSSQDK